MELSSSTIRLLITLFVALGSLTYGYCSCIIATTLGQPSFLTYFALETRSNATSLTGAMTGLYQAGGLFGTLSCIFTADKLGRRKAMVLGALVTLIGGALQAGSVNVAMFIAARFITGLGIGSLVTLVPLYQSEIAPPQIRGLLVGMHGVLIGTGYALGGWAGVAFYFVPADSAQWRIPLAIQCLPPLCLAVGIMILPETPRWLLTQHRDDEAYAAFKATRAEETNDITQEDLIHAEFDQLRSQLLAEQAHSVKFIDMFTMPSMRKRCIIGFLTMLGAQATGTLVINNYGTTLYKSLGFGTVQQLLMAAGWVTVAPLGNWLNAVIVDRVGRVRMLLIGYVGCLIALIGESATVAIFERTGKQSVASAAVFFLFLHVCVFTCTIDATTYIYSSEIFPTVARAKGMAISVSGLFLSSLVFLMAAGTAFQKYTVETRQRSLEHMGALFGDPIEAVNVADTSEVSSEVNKNTIKEQKSEN